MDFPPYALRPVSITAQMTEEAIGVKPEEAYMACNLLCAFDFVDTVMSTSFII